ncbi:MAG: hypothetical protein J6B50_03325 [Lachnospiraceae bacterium]|nr:hypothetical protein [Lachnospiraceae bacterium]
MSETVKSKKNNGLYAVGGVSIINMVVLLLCTFLCVMSMVNYCMQAAVPSRGLGYYYVPHLLVGLVFGISLIIMAIGGFKRNHVLCLIATILYGVDLIVARVFDYFSHAIMSADYLRNPLDVIGTVLAKGRSVIYFRQSCLAGTIFLAIGLLLVAIVLVIKCTKAKGGVVRVIGIIVAGLATATLGITSLADIIMLNVVNAGMVGLSVERIPYITLFIKRIGHFFQASGDWRFLMEMEPMFFMILDVLILAMFATMAISSALTISGKKDVENV